jgi:RNA polymerase sigma factor (sigma-70 family)
MITEDEMLLAQKVARSQSYKWKLEEDEILSNLYLWLCEQQKYVVAYREDPHGKQKLSLALTRAAIKQCKQEKSIQAGGEQQNHYTIPQLKKILPYIWEVPTFTHTTAQTQDTANLITTIVIDVAQAYHALPISDKQILETHYRDGKTYKETAAVYDITEEAARKRITRALTRLHSRLGGEPPIW